MHSLAQPGKAALIQALLDSLHTHKIFNGALVVGENHQVIFSKGYGYADIEKRLPFDPMMPGDGGSLAKTLTAASIIILANQHKFDLKDPVQWYLPTYPYTHTSILNLVTHSTGGLPDYGYYFDKIPDTSILTNDNILQILASRKPALRYDPGKNFYYDSPGFDLAALLLEKVTGKHYGTFLSESFFKPLQMDQSFTRPARLSHFPLNRVIGYQNRQDSLLRADIADREGFYGGSNVIRPLMTYRIPLWFFIY